MPVFNMSKNILEEAICSVINQTNNSWELIVCDDNSKKNETLEVLNTFKNHPQITVLYSGKSLGISGATNLAASKAQGDYLAFIDHDDTLVEHAVEKIIDEILNNDKPDILYSDEDKIDLNGNYVEPYFKPDFSPEHLHSVMYMLHIFILKKRLFETLGGLRSNYDGAQDYDLALRATDLSDSVFHIREILYHWRMVDGSASMQVDAKPWALECGFLALNDFLSKSNGYAEKGLSPGIFRARYPLNKNERVTLVIITAGFSRHLVKKGKVILIKNFIESIIKKSTFKNYDLLIINSGIIDGETKDLILSINGKIIDFPFKDNFNYAKAINYSIQFIENEFVVFLNDDLEVISDDWIESLAELLKIDKVGAVGGKLLYENHLIQHVGMYFNRVFPYTHHFLYQSDENTPDYYNFTGLIRNYSCVTGAVFATKLTLLKKLNGFDETYLSDYNDTDYCLRLVQEGYRIVYTPHCMLYHYENSSFKRKTVNQLASKIFYKKWKNFLIQDQFFNDNVVDELKKRSTKILKKKQTDLRSRYIIDSYNFYSSTLLEKNPEFQAAKSVDCESEFNDYIHTTSFCNYKYSYDRLLSITNIQATSHPGFSCHIYSYEKLLRSDNEDIKSLFDLKIIHKELNNKNLNSIFLNLIFGFLLSPSLSFGNKLTFTYFFELVINQRPDLNAIKQNTIDLKKWCIDYGYTEYSDLVMLFKKFVNTELNYPPIIESAEKFKCITNKVILDIKIHFGFRFANSFRGETFVSFFNSFGDIKLPLKKILKSSYLEFFHKIIICSRKDLAKFSLTEFTIWFDLHGFKEFPKLVSGFLNYFNRNKDIDLFLVNYQSHYPFQVQKNLTSGINLFANFSNTSGISSSAHAIKMSLEKYQKIYKVNCIDISLNISNKIYDNSSINLFVMSPFTLVDFLLINGQEFMKNSYNIAYLPWEFDKISSKYPINNLSLDEIWTTSSFSAKAFESFDNEVHVFPEIVDFHNYIQIKNRKDFDLKDNIFYFLFSFDFLSSPKRKNIHELINVFNLLDKKLKSKIGLIIKILNSNNELLETIKQKCKFTNLHLIHEQLDHNTYLDLINASDAVISLHRCEGFGRLMAEAMYLNKPCIGSNYSGNKDFMNDDNSYLVHGRIVNPKMYEYQSIDSNKFTWFEFDYTSALKVIEQCYHDRNSNSSKLYNASEFIRRKYSYEAAKIFIQTRLDALNN